jgi:hypothetical protein
VGFCAVLFSDDPRLRMPTFERPSGGCAERHSALRHAHAPHATHNRHFPRLTLAGPISPIYSAEKGPGVIIDSEIDSSSRRRLPYLFKFQRVEFLDRPADIY